MEILSKPDSTKVGFADTLKIKIIKDSVYSTNTKTIQHTTVETINYTAHTKNKIDWCDCKLLNSAIWPLIVLLILIIFGKTIKKLLNKILKRFDEGAEFAVGPHGLSIGKGAKAAPYEKTDLDGKEFSPSFPIDNDSAKRIISTLWIHQNDYDKTYNVRWTFAIGGNKEFDATIMKLLWLGIVTFDKSSSQYFLTDFGLHYCQINAAKLGDFSYFK
jgi:hypothetical protein